MVKSSSTGIKRILDAFKFSREGLVAVWKSEEAFRQEIVASIFLLPLSFYISENHIELLLLVSSVFLVVICELVNSAIESVVDRIGIEFHGLSKKAKDIGSAFVLLAIILLFFVWGTILLN